MKTNIMIIVAGSIFMGGLAASFLTGQANTPVSNTDKSTLSEAVSIGTDLQKVDALSRSVSYVYLNLSEELAKASTRCNEEFSEKIGAVSILPIIALDEEVSASVELEVRAKIDQVAGLTVDLMICRSQDTSLKGAI